MGTCSCSDVGQREYNIYKGRRNILGQVVILVLEKRQSKGDQLANFKQGNGDYAEQAGLMMELILPMVKKYPANDFGLYDMGM
jgi:hypothetical protein